MDECVWGEITYAHMCHSCPVCLVTPSGVSLCGVCQPVRVTGGEGQASNQGGVKMNKAWTVQVSEAGAQDGRAME